MDGPSIFECDMDALNQDIPNFDDPTAEDSCHTEEVGEGTVNVEKALMQTLSNEVNEVATMLTSNKWNKLRGTNDTMPCPFCPCRQFRNLYKQGKGPPSCSRHPSPFWQ